MQISAMQGVSDCLKRCRVCGCGFKSEGSKSDENRELSLANAVAIHLLVAAVHALSPHMSAIEGNKQSQKREHRQRYHITYPPRI